MNVLRLIALAIIFLFALAVVLLYFFQAKLIFYPGKLVRDFKFKIGPLDQGRSGALDFCRLCLFQCGGKAGERPFGREQAMHAALRIGPGRRHGMKPEQQAWTGGLRGCWLLMAHGLARMRRLAGGLVLGHDGWTLAQVELRYQRSYRTSLVVDNVAEIPIVRISVPGDWDGWKGGRVVKGSRL